MAKTYYEILQVLPDASAEVIRAAYRSLSAKYHPDKDGSKEAAELFAQIQLAFETLSDADRRARYNAELQVNTGDVLHAGNVVGQVDGASSHSLALRDSQSESRVWKPQAIAILMLLWALSPTNPYAYFIALRFVCCGVFTYLGAKFAVRNKYPWAWAMGILAVLYNPFVSIHLNRTMWSVINVLTVVVLATSVYASDRSSRAIAGKPAGSRRHDATK